MSNPKLNPEFKAAWLAALRSGEYKQGKYALNSDRGFCCLGVACDVAMKMGLVQADWVKLSRQPENALAFMEKGDSTDYGLGLPPNFAVRAMFADGEVHAFITGDHASFAALNDQQGLTFAQLADIIEAEF